jgi:hypothetical protein
MFQFFLSSHSVTVLVSRSMAFTSEGWSYWNRQNKFNVQFLFIFSIVVYLILYNAASTLNLRRFQIGQKLIVEGIQYRTLKNLNKRSKYKKRGDYSKYYSTMGSEYQTSPVFELLFGWNRSYNYQTIWKPGIWKRDHFQLLSCFNH